MAERKGPARSAGGSRGTASKAKTKAAPKAKTAAKTKAKGKAPVKRQRAKRPSKATKRAAETGQAVGAGRTVKQAATYAKVWADWAQGMDWATIAARNKLGERRCEQIVDEMRASRIAGLRIKDPLGALRIAEDLLLQRQAAVSQYAVEAANTPDAERAVRLGFLKRRDEALGSLIQLLQELDVLPKHLGTLRVQEDFLTLVDALLDKMDELGLALDVQRALVEAVELRVASGADGRLRIAAGSADAEATAEEEMVDAAAA
jgi:hypothetical protein